MMVGKDKISREGMEKKIYSLSEQALNQRDYFGAHMYERIDKPRGEFFHTNWTGRGGETASSAYLE
jgi:6-phosphogluconate dehydrogenase